MKRLFFTLLVLIIFCAQNAFSQCDGNRYLTKVFNQIKIQNAVDYGGIKLAIDGSQTKLDYDLYEPKDDTAALRPLVIMMHGGAFFNFPIVTKRSPDIVELSTDLAKRGYVVISPEYRLLRNPLSLVNEKAMVQIVAATLFDINGLLCKMVERYNNGNPDRIDINRVFVGGVSAGAVIALQGLYLDTKEQLGQPFLTYAEEMAAKDGIDITEDVLANKFCNAKILGGVSISGALLDTNWIVKKETGILFIHGTKDPIIPYGYDYPFGINTLPKLAGPEVIFDIIKNTGTTVEQDIYEGAGHVPFFGLSLDELFDSNPSDFIFDIERLDSTKNHIAQFFYKLMGCELPVVGIAQHTNYGNLNIYPNPNNGYFIIEIPEAFYAKNGHYEMVDIIGRTVKSGTFDMNNHKVVIDSKLSKGIYVIKLSSDEVNIKYTGKILVND